MKHAVTTVVQYNSSMHRDVLQAPPAPSSEVAQVLASGGGWRGRGRRGPGRAARVLAAQRGAAAGNGPGAATRAPQRRPEWPSPPPHTPEGQHSTFRSVAKHSPWLRRG